MDFFRLMYVTVKPIYTRDVPMGYPLPSVGEHIEIEEKRYVVSSRTWDIDINHYPGVAIHVREY